MLTEDLTLAAAIRGLALLLCCVGDLAAGWKTAALSLSLDPSSLARPGVSACDVVAAEFPDLSTPLLP